MTKDDAIAKVRKLRKLAQSGTPEAATAAMHADRLVEKYEIEERDLAEPIDEARDQRIWAGSGVDLIKELDLEIRNNLRAVGRKVGRFVGHPHADQILRARARKAGAV